MNIFLPLPLPLTPRQWLYLAGTQCLIAGVVDGGANFGIAYAMYHAQADVRMWVFSKNTIAGDLGVTPLIQCALSMIITSTLVHTDIHHSAVKPLSFVYPHISRLPDPTIFVPFLRTPCSLPPVENKSDIPSTEVNYKRTFPTFCKAVIRFIFEGTENNMLLDWNGPVVFLKRLVWTAVQGLGIGVVFGLPLWCLAVVILGPIYGNGNMGNKWAPQAIKLVYGFILGILTNPLIAILALGSQAEHHLLVVEQPSDIEKQGQVEQTTMPSPPGGRSLTLIPSSTGSRRRPSIIANGSGMLAPPSLAGSSPILTRPRALTSASETVSVYSLGGTGGRAQRPRGGSRASEFSMAPPSTAMPAESPGPARVNPGGWRSDYGVPPSPSLSTRNKAPGPAGVMRLMTEGLETPRESLEGREGDDVFGSRPVDTTL